MAMNQQLTYYLRLNLRSAQQRRYVLYILYSLALLETEITFGLAGYNITLSKKNSSVQW